MARITAPNLDLSSFPRPEIRGNRGLLARALWYLASAFLFRHPLALLPYSLKAAILRLFGARVGRGVVIKPNVTIKYPWFLAIGDHSWLGEAAWIDNPDHVTIGSNVCISQGVYIVTGNHDYKDRSFRFFSSPIEVGDRCWVCAKAILPPGSVLPAGTISPMGAVWRNTPERTHAAND